MFVVCKIVKVKIFEFCEDFVVGEWCVIVSVLRKFVVGVMDKVDGVIF